MQDTPGFFVGGGLGFSNTAIVVLGALAGGVIAYKFFKNGDVNLKTERAMTNQDYIEDEIYKTMYATAAYPATVRENADRIRESIRRYRTDVNTLVGKLRRKEITAAEFRTQLRALAQQINSELGIGQLGELARADRKATCEQRIEGAIVRIQASRLSGPNKDRIVAKLSQRKARC